MVPGPINDADRQGLATVVAHLTHGIFYALFAVLPLTGWILWSSVQPARPLHLAGLVPVPAMPFHDLSPEWQYWRSEEHTSELQSLMRISYAVFCLKKKNKTTHKRTTKQVV